MMKNKLIAISTLALPALAVAQEHAETVAGTPAAGYAYLAAGLGLGLAAAMVGYAQSRAASAALDGIARNPAAAKPVFLPLILSLAFMEALVLFSLIISFQLVGK